MKSLSLLLLFGYVSLLVEARVPRQLPPQRRCPDSQCPATPGPYMGVTITTDGTYRNVNTSTCPPYNNPEWTNPNMACISQTTFRIPLNPSTNPDGGALWEIQRRSLPPGKPYTHIWCYRRVKYWCKRLWSRIAVWRQCSLPRRWSTNSIRQCSGGGGSHS